MALEIQAAPTDVQLGGHRTGLACKFNTGDAACRWNHWRPKIAPRKPRYQELAADLRAGIKRGDFPDPSNFPTESMLCGHYGVSRFTVREALRALQSEGLIQRRRGSGTVIQSAVERDGALHQPLSNVGEILQYAQDTRYLFAARGLGQLPKQLVAHTATPPAQRWFRFRGIRTRDGDPIALTDAYIHRDFAHLAAEIRPNEATIFRQLERLSGVSIARVVQDIEAVAMPAAMATELGVRPRTPCLRFLRCYLDADGRIMEISASHHPGEKFVYTVNIAVKK